MNKIVHYLLKPSLDIEGGEMRKTHPSPYGLLAGDQRPFILQNTQLKSDDSIECFRAT